MGLVGDAPQHRGVGVGPLGHGGAFGGAGRLVATFVVLAAVFVAFFVDVFFAVFVADFLVVFAAFFVGALFAVFLTGLRARVEGSAFRRSASSSAARSKVIVSGASPSRKVAFVSPSVT